MQLLGRSGSQPVRDPGGGGRLGCSGLSRRPPVAPGSPQPTSPFPDDRPAHVRRKTSRPRAHPPSAAGGRWSLCFAQRRRRVRQKDASREFPATRMRWRRALRDCGDAHTACCVSVWCLIARPLGAGSREGSGATAARGCAGQRPGCGRPPRLGFAARGRCGRSWGVLSRASALVRGESGCAGGARVGARRRGSGASNSRTLTEYSPQPACDAGGRRATAQDCSTARAPSSRATKAAPTLTALEFLHV